MQNDVDGARRILHEAFSSLPGNEQIWLAAVKLEKENGEYDLARGVLERARTSAGTERVWMKSALLERDLGNLEAEANLLKTAIAKFQKFDKLYLMSGQVNFTREREERERREREREEREREREEREEREERREGREKERDSSHISVCRTTRTAWKSPRSLFRRCQEL
jgi:hypothetical protein